MSRSLWTSGFAVPAAFAPYSVNFESFGACVSGLRGIINIWEGSRISPLKLQPFLSLER